VLLYLLISAVLVGLSLTILVLIRRFIHYQTRQRHNDVAGFIFAVVGVIYGVMLAFVAIMVWEQYDKAMGNALKEASETLAMYQDLNLYPNRDQANRGREALLAFVHSVIEDEYPAMARTKRSPATDQAINNLWSAAKTIKPQNLHEQSLYNVILRDLNSLAKLRAERLAVMESNLPGIVWFALIIGAVITLIFAVLFGAEKFPLHIVLTCLLAVLIATTMFVILELDNPFITGLAARPTGYMAVLEIIGGR
jgi:hypothetical protein